MDKYKIVVLDGYTCNPGDLSWDMFLQVGSLEVYDRTPDSAGIILERIGDADIVLTNKTGLTEAIIMRMLKVRYIGVLATGFNVVDTAAARRAGIAVTNIPAYSTMSVAQFTFALLLELCHHAGAHSDAVFRGDWSRSEDFCFWNYPLLELAGKTFGIIGFGRIGQAVSSIAVAFGMKVLAFDRSPDYSLENNSCRYADLDTLLRESDIISLHCPLTEETRGLINSNTIGKMKAGILIINTARGPLVNEQDLFSALDSGKVGAAALDVLSTEPADHDNPLLKAKNCIITPHIAWAPKAARERLIEIAFTNLLSFVSGNPVNVVN
ncbi:MAG: D-2-hydroxyacid dehydrogenase [Bacteroidales bacterium]|jgi:glycerate dehydrogenase|nr:D-2-hydroxyacid dehydrogenase [Bacteroidales bacterium]